ncbi:MAG: molybdopterin dinucleotide binding domain-containing protein [Candidatus Thorarchaeota archaeon]
MEFILNTSRKIDNDQVKEFAFGNITSLEKNLAVAFLNPLDLKKLRLKSSNNVKITSQNGSIIVKCAEDSKVPEGMILLPVSIWSNQLTEIEGDEIKYKNIKVQVEMTTDSILHFNDILKTIRGN